jgi:mono/diheme cytochrome c family protein
MPSDHTNQEARMLKPFFVLLALLFFAPSPQQPVAPPAAPAAAAPTIPPEAVRMVNPVRPTAESQTHAKKVYGYDCAMCHGANGNGKGDVVADLKLTLKDYTDAAALKDMTDGELFYIIKNGKGQMPGEGDRAKPDDLWNMVILVRSFSKK